MTQTQRDLTRTIDGRTVIARQPALTPHPHPSQNRRLVPTTGVDELLLEDGSTTYECVECGKMFYAAISARAHMTSHNPAKTNPAYPWDTLALVVHYVEERRAEHGVRNSCVEVAARLTTEGVPAGRSGTWSANIVSHVYVRWSGHPEVRRRVIALRRTSAAARHASGVASAVALAGRRRTRGRERAVVPAGAEALTRRSPAPEPPVSEPPEVAAADVPAPDVTLPDERVELRYRRPELAEAVQRMTGLCNDLVAAVREVWTLADRADRLAQVLDVTPEDLAELRAKAAWVDSLPPRS